jgi:beta-N-acetylhexosaminidase
MSMALGDQTSLADRKRRAGQRMFIGIFGHAVDEDARKLIAELQPAGFVIFARNVAEPAQVLDLNRELASLVDAHRPALISVDQEGGRVARVRKPATEFPPMRVLGRANDLALTAQVGSVMARELRAMGFHLDFAPVGDVDSNPDNPVIGDRSFGPEPKAVSDHVAAYIRGMQAEHIIACIKHFPGHGDTDTDSHRALPVVAREIEALRALELPPFRAAIAAGVGTVMTSHVMFPAWDEEWPATLSPKILRPLLRDELGFDGVVFSDDMDMKAVADRWPIPVQVRQATEAGVDVLLCCNEPLRQVNTFEALVQLQEASKAHEGAFVESLRRLDALRERFLLGAGVAPGLSVVGSREHQQVAERVRERGEWLA